MGIKLSSNGGLTLSQRNKCGGDKTKEAALLAKLSKEPINKKLLEDRAKEKAAKVKAAEERSQTGKPSTKK